MSTLAFEGDLVVTGNLSIGNVELDANLVNNNHVRDEGNPIEMEKTEHAYSITYSQNDTNDVAAETKTIHVAQSAGTVVSIKGGHITAKTGTNHTTVKLQKNGVDILSATMELDSAAYANESGTISSAAYVAGDVFELEIGESFTSGTRPKGLFVNVCFREGAP